MSDDIRTARINKLHALRQQGDAYPNDFRRQHLAGDLLATYSEQSREQLADASITVTIAARIMLQRNMGKSTFLTVQDMSGRIQVFFNNKIENLAVDELAAAEDWDLGDIIGVCGTLFKTKTDELTIRATSLRLLTKALQPLPEKFHGVTDPAIRYRQRYVSLMTNPEERNVFTCRSATVRYLRDFFHDRGYLEAETPILQNIPGGAAARPFVTHCNALGHDFYLRIAQELHLKRLIVGGFEKVFEINKNFRNEGLSPRHNPEFTMLEFNAAYEDCESYLNFVEELLHGLVVHITGGETINYQGQDISFQRPFARLSPLQALLAHQPQFSEQQLQQKDFLLQQLATQEGERVQQIDDSPVEELQLLLFEKIAEHLLIQPTFLVDYPAGASPLAKRSNKQPHLAERFELFIAGRELVNGFSELNDPEAQAAIFQQQAEQKESGDLEAMHYDADYIHALECGLPPNAGGGIGIDRLVMLLTDQAAIRDVILFPQLRPSE